MYYFKKRKRKKECFKLFTAVLNKKGGENRLILNRTKEKKKEVNRAELLKETPKDSEKQI